MRPAPVALLSFAPALNVVELIGSFSAELQGSKAFLVL